MENNEQIGPQSSAPHVGLCESCVHARVIPHPRGGEAYWRCAMSDVDKSFPKYPRLPVVLCRGYEPGRPSA